MTMRPPTAQVLRALRSALHPPSTSSTACTAKKSCQRPLRALQPRRYLSTSPSHLRATNTSNPHAPTHSDRGPKSKEDTQTDFNAMDVLGHIPAAATSVDACTSDGFHLDNGVKTEGGRGIILVGGEAFEWEPWRIIAPENNPATQAATPGPGMLLDTRRGTLAFPTQTLGLLELLHPKPDLLIIGTGGKLWMLDAATRKYIGDVLGCRIDAMDTPNAAAAYNLLAKERGIEGGAGVGAILLPIGWVGPKTAVARKLGRRGGA